MSDSLKYKLTSGKPSKALYFIKGYLKDLCPKTFYYRRAERLLSELDSRSDKDYILDRVEYYCRHQSVQHLPQETVEEHHGHYYYFLNNARAFKPSTFHKAYYFDLVDATRYFDSNKRICYVPGDVYFTPKHIALVKSRLLNDNNSNSVILKLDKLRHFMFVNDAKSFIDKQNRAIFRGKIRYSRQRTLFLEKYFGSEICDCGIVGNPDGHPEWLVPKKTIHEHLDYKYIMALEGNDVASNLKWVMSSNSIAVMPRPTCETWFMEGRLIPDYHYIEINADLSDLEQKLSFYTAHPELAQRIIENAHQYIAQFRDSEREELIQILVMKRYFELTGQL